MKKLLAIVAVAIPMMATPVVTYTTQGFFGTPPANPDTQPGTGLEYVGTPNVIFGGGTVDLGASNPSFVNFGYFNTSALIGTVGTVSLAGPFTLRINQTGIDVGSGTADFSATISGTIDGNASNPGSASNAKIVFDNPVVNPYTNDSGPMAIISGVRYQVGHTTYLIAAPTAGQITSINGSIFVPGLDVPPTGVPEPGTIGLIGLGLAAVGLAARRRRA